MAISRQRVAPLALLLAVPLGCSGGERAAFVEVGPCSNPNLVLDGEVWLTQDRVPESAVGSAGAELIRIDGTVTDAADPDALVFRADEGFYLEYRRPHGFEPHPCLIG